MAAQHCHHTKIITSAFSRRILHYIPSSVNFFSDTVRYVLVCSTKTEKINVDVCVPAFSFFRCTHNQLIFLDRFDALFSCTSHCIIQFIPSTMEWREVRNKEKYISVNESLRISFHTAKKF